jgi:hypothetical protein
MYVEQLLRECEVCNRRFAVQYEYGAPRIPSASSDRVAVRVVSCPSCRHLNPLIMLMYAYHVAVKSIPGPDPVDVRVRANTLRRLLSSPRYRAAPPATSRRPISWQLMAAAAELARRIRPFLP